ncbi:MAG TPA: hypothetical protein VGF24_18285 [Vicinamibacterales bacterium]
MTRMHNWFVLVLALGGAIAAPGADAQTAYSVSASVGDFHVAVSNYYQVPERDVIVVRERRIPDEELPVVFFIAQRAHVPPARIVDMRLRGSSWWDISVRYGLNADVYYVPVAVRTGPPYGRAYGHYKKPRKEWRTLVLTDADIVNLVELRFMSEHYHVPPERIIEMRERNVDFVSINRDVSGRRVARDRDDDDDQGENRDHGRGKKH